MDPRNIAALQTTVEFDGRYAELHEKARQLAYNLCVDISRNNHGISMDTKYYIANVCVNEGINTYLEAKWILSNPNNVRILHEEAIANGMLPAAAADCVPPNYPSPTTSEDSVKTLAVEPVGFTVAPSSSGGQARVAGTTSYMNNCPQITPAGFLLCPNSKFGVENPTVGDTMYDPNVIQEKSVSC